MSYFWSLQLRKAPIYKPSFCCDLFTMGMCRLVETTAPGTVTDCVIQLSCSKIRDGKTGNEFRKISSKYLAQTTFVPPYIPALHVQLYTVTIYSTGME